MTTRRAVRTPSTGPPEPPLLRFLNACQAEFSAETCGAVADYIPELGKADPDHFGISLATLDGHVYEVGDTRVPFTIQSMSKPFVFALALDAAGRGAGRERDRRRAVGRSLQFDPAQCRQPSVQSDGQCRRDRLLRPDPRSQGRRRVRVYPRRRSAASPAATSTSTRPCIASESATGDRNRAIGYLLRNSEVITDDVGAVLDVYFRQCAVLVTARDIAVMAATLANRGVNPVTGEQVVTPYAISRTLSVMTSSGMYDYAGEWIYRIGIPAKSGVGGGILAALPARLGLGSYSPRLDKHGNSVRGIKVCEALSSHYDLHMLNRSDDARNGIIADYDIGNSPSRRSRRPQERDILAAHQQDVRVIELVGTLSLSNVDYVSRQLAANRGRNSSSSTCAASRR